MIIFKKGKRFAQAFGCVGQKEEYYGETSEMQRYGP
jgi:hypothetical protein